MCLLILAAAYVVGVFLMLAFVRGGRVAPSDVCDDEEPHAVHR
jgi:hypothetical protein